MIEINKYEATSPGVFRTNERALSLIERLAMLGERSPLIKADPEASLKAIFIGLIKVYAYLGHNNIFKGNQQQTELAKVKINEIASQILEGYRNNKEFRRITDQDFEAIIEKGCSSALGEIKTVSPSSIFTWTTEFNKKYLQDILKKRMEYQEIETGKQEDKNEGIRQMNLNGVQALLQYCEKPITSEVADVKQYQGYWIAKICKRYGKHLPESFIKNFSQRKDLYKEAKEKAVKKLSTRATVQDVTSLATKLYCYLITDEFTRTVDFEGPEEFEKILKNAINDFHDENK